MIKKTLAELVGNTPILELEKYKNESSLKGNIFAKLESFNPTGSVKDRIALAMINAAEKSGQLKKGSTIIEPTSGNTGIGLAAIGRSKGYRVILTMPETMSVERRQILVAYGAELVLTEGPKGMKRAIAKAQELAETTPNSFVPDQFGNPVNPAVHLATTGPEIWETMEGKVDFLVSGVGTGGTLTGAGEYLKSKNSGVKIIAVEPSASPVLSGGEPSPHGIQGIGAGFVPKVLKTELIDEIIQVSNEEAYAAARAINEIQSIFAGTSSGAALHAAKVLAMREENLGKNIVVIFPDGGEKYLSTPLYN